MPPAPPATAARPKKGIGLPGSPAVWIGVLAVALAGGAWLLWKRRQASTAASTAASDAAPADAAGTGQDAGQLGTLQAEIGDLQSSEAQEPAAGGGGAPAPAKVKVPNVVGQSQEAGFAILSAAGLRASGTTVVPGRTLIVKAQSPAAGAMADKGSTVTLQSALAPAKTAQPPPRPPVVRPVTGPPPRRKRKNQLITTPQGPGAPGPR